jgi:hypothetical protein
VSSPKGDSVNPMTRDEVSRKFTDCVRAHLGTKTTEEVIHQFNCLELLSDLSQLSGALGVHTALLH